MKRTGAQSIWASLEKMGVTTVFGYPGGAILPTYDALTEFPSIRHILVRHEQGATHMADGYARAGGGVGVAIATSGPGATNMVTGMATAMMDSTPMVCITGQVGAALIGTEAFQETDITGVTLPITKHNYLVTRAEGIAPTLREAFHVARTGRPGPVHVDITKDAQQNSCTFEWDDTEIQLPGLNPARALAPESIRKALELLAAAERPLILAGHGILLSGATQVMRAFAERCDIPCAMTLLGISAIPAEHPLNLGMMGMHGEAWVNQAIQDADLLIACGMRFDDRVTGNLKNYAPNARKIHIDIDPTEFNKNVRIDVALAGDLREILEQLLPHLGERRHPDWHAKIAVNRGHAAVRDITNLPDDGHLYAAHVIHDLWKATGGNAIVATDVGQHQMWEAQYYKHNEPRTLLTSGGLGTMGFALPAAIGAKLARPDADVWAVAGDGGFQMTMPELGTMAQEHIKVNVAIINNGYLGMVRQWQQFFYEKRYTATPILSPDYAKVAEAYGLKGQTVRQRSEVIPAAQAARAHGKAVIIDFQVEQEDSVYPMVPTGAALHEMITRGTTKPANPIVETSASV